MARLMRRLSARAVETIARPGRHADGGGLYLVVGPGASRRWVFLFRRDGRLKEMGLGGLVSVPLVEARRKAENARRIVVEGGDPIARRRSEEAKRGMATTFGVFSDQLVAELSHGFRNAKHRAQWAMTLTTYAAPLRDKQLNEISTDDVLGVLKPIWRTKSETASRVRGRIERVLDAAKAKGLRGGENPARWRGHLQTLLEPRRRLTRGHHPALPFNDMPAFIARLRAAAGASAFALEFLILAAARSGEVLGAKWSEIDRERNIWTVPANRMKGGREHRVPLTGRMLAILGVIENVRIGDFVFPGQKKSGPLSPMALDMVLRRLKIENATVHGFRSTFRDWAAEETSFPREIAEAALAHVIGDTTERAYRRGDALQKRRELMEAWAAFCDGMSSAGNVVTFRRS